METRRPGNVTPQVLPPWSVLETPNSWRHIDFISDLHLQASEPATFDLWRRYMQHTQADAIIILGDLFEVWIGDDMVNAPPTPPETLSFELQCAQVLKTASQRLKLYFMHGNRDFLLGSAFAQTCGMALINDPTILQFGGEQWLLSHGDALCLDDTQYMKFRADVRTPQWQNEFLKQSLTERQHVARALRNNSESRKGSGIMDADLDTEATCDWLRATQTPTLIHGHTHRPADHDLKEGLRRVVLSDWDASSKPARSEVLRLSLNDDKSVVMRRLNPAQTNVHGHF